MYDDRGTFWDLIADLYRETSQAVFWGFVLGIVVGVAAALCGAVAFVAEWPTVSVRLAVCVLAFAGFGGLMVGAVVGCLIGSLLDFVLAALFGRSGSETKRRRKRWRPPTGLTKQTRWADVQEERRRLPVMWVDEIRPQSPTHPQSDEADRSEQTRDNIRRPSE